MHVEDGRDQADTVSIASEAVMDPPPAVFQFGDASVDYAPHSVEGSTSFLLIAITISTRETFFN